VDKEGRCSGSKRRAVSTTKLGVALHHYLQRIKAKRNSLMIRELVTVGLIIIDESTCTLWKIWLTVRKLSV